MTRVEYREPYDYEGILRFLAARAIPGVEAVDSASYARTFRAQGGQGFIVVSNDAMRRSLTVESNGEGAPVWLASRVVHLFDTEHDPAPMIHDLERSDPSVLGSPMRAGIRVPGAWDPFELCVRAIVGQQISVSGARTLLGRIAQRFGELTGFDSADLTTLFPTPEAIADAELESIGLTGARSETLRETGRLFAGERDRDDDEWLARLLPRLESIRGVGPWTAGYVAMRGIKDPDAYPIGDLGLRSALEAKRVSARELARRAERWRPWRAYVSMALWARLAGSPKEV